MSDYVRIKLVAWTAEIEGLKAQLIMAEKEEIVVMIDEITDRFFQINREILTLLGEDEPD